MNIYSFTKEDLEHYFEKIGEKKYKSLQIYDWLYKKRVTSFDDMSNIKKDITIINYVLKVYKYYLI